MRANTQVPGFDIRASTRTLRLARGWAIQSSSEIRAAGSVVSSPGFDVSDWHATCVPATVLGALLETGLYPDPFFADNLKSIPGQGPHAINFSNHPMPDGSPFKASWWYRCEFRLPQPLPFNQHWLQFDGINYRADIWVNGQLIADRQTIAGAYRAYELNVTQALRLGEVNVIAIEVFPPNPCDLAITWVDWNPSPPDKNMGIWRDVRLAHSNAVSVRGTQVTSKLSPDHANAQIAVNTELCNATPDPQRATVRVRFDEHPGWELSKLVELLPNQTRQVEFTAAECAELSWQNPKLWWPRLLGMQNFYHVEVEVILEGTVSDAEQVRFAIREVRCNRTAEGHSLFTINGQKLQIRGAGWATDLFLRQRPERDELELAYLLDLNLNTIRFEGMLECNEFLDRCDEQGLLVMAGWCCCDHWEKWGNWSGGDVNIAEESLRSQLRRVRNHPSLITWMYGSDFAPPPEVEQRYLKVIEEERWPNPVHSSASHRPAELTGSSGMKMLGPYDYVPPNYWSTDTTRGGAFGFATEISPGPAVPPIESLRKMLPKDRLWPIGELWNFHAGGQEFSHIRFFTQALNARYGEATSAEDFATKAQLMTYEAQRAMFEAYTANKYQATGVIQWMLNNAWPSLIWHLYDYYLRPAGGYFGTKKACEDLHIQYSYGDRSLIVVNNLRVAVPGLTAIVRVCDIEGVEVLHQVRKLDIGADACLVLGILPEFPLLGDAYFLRLELNLDTQPLSTNFYWLSQKPDVLDHDRGSWVHTPVSQYADFSALMSMPKARVSIQASLRQDGKRQVVTTRLSNGDQQLAFFCQLRLLRELDHEEVLPLVWEDNYLSLLPGEERVIEASFGVGVTPYDDSLFLLELSGINVETQQVVVHEPMVRKRPQKHAGHEAPLHGAFLQEEAE